eukprot:scaffold6790_cov69-Phaeocystis_antarctica.AAC.12
MSSLLASDKEVAALNMDCMSVTLDVSKLSGWLNADACCRVSQGGHTVRSGPGNGRRRATAAHAACRAGLDCRLGVGHGEERTWNMAFMVVTLEVLKLSGWLNADASCRESNGGHTVRGARGGAHKEHVSHVCDAGGVEAQRLVERPCVVEHGVHVCDAGGVEAQRLVERRRALPRVESIVHTMHGEVRAWRREVAGDGGARSVQGTARV